MDQRWLHGRTALSASATTSSPCAQPGDLDYRAWRGEEGRLMGGRRPGTTGGVFRVLAAVWVEE